MDSSRKFANDILGLINEVRVDPTAHNQKFEVIKAGYSIIKNSPVPKEIDAYLKYSVNLDASKPLSLSEGLCRLAESQLRTFIEKNYAEKGFDSVNVKKRAVDFVDKVGTILQVVESVPKAPIEIMGKLFFNPMDKEKKFRAAIQSNTYSKVGIAHSYINRDEIIVIIFCDKCLEKVRTDLDELKKAFDIFDVNEIGKIDVKEIVAAMRSLGYNPINPIFQIMKELDSSDYSPNGLIDWDTFVNYVTGRVEDTRSEDGLRRIFDLFVGNPGEKTITLASLRRICNELNESKYDEQLEDMIKRASSSGEELTFEEFKEFMRRKYEEN
jgi:Ca2+-binding EF-hand superfamily protein